MISVICPVLNEEKYIEQVLHLYLNTEVTEKELFIIDGGSSDQTRKIVNDYQSQDSSIRLIHNEKKYVPFALNLAIELCKGEYIIRLDAHTTYSHDYFERILGAFDISGAEIVGGPMRSVGVNDFQKAVAYSTSTQLGVGNSTFHFENFKGFTDSVYLGAWKKEIFNSIGLFDEMMIRNQDDEFHYRAKKAGLKIYQDPKIVSYYYPRDSWRNLFNQYYQYGLYKPLVLQKIKSQTKLRHIIPALFVLFCITMPIGVMVSWFYGIPLFIYGLLLLRFSFLNNLNWGTKFYCLLVYPTLHFAYGVGFLRGLFREVK